MRDPARIDKMIGQLRAVWKAHPDLRLGQLLEAAAARANRHAIGEPIPLFYMEDGLLSTGLRSIKINGDGM